MKRSPIRSRRRTPRRSSRVRDADFMAWVRTLPCAAREAGLDSAYPCGGEVEADHAGRRGLGQKADDATTIPLCTQHHRERTDFSGAFKTWTHPMMRRWLAEAVGKTQALRSAQMEPGR